MNVKMHNIVSMISSMVRIPQQAAQTKQAGRELGEEKPTAETDKQEETVELDSEWLNIQNQGTRLRGTGEPADKKEYRGDPPGLPFTPPPARSPWRRSGLFPGAVLAQEVGDFETFSS
jgi:hypothetical protein